MRNSSKNTTKKMMRGRKRTMVMVTLNVELKVTKRKKISSMMKGL